MPSRSFPRLLAAGATVVLLTTGCSRSRSRDTWAIPPEGSPSLLFAGDGSPTQPIARQSTPADAGAAARDWDIDRTLTGTVNAQGGQLRRRVRASRQVGGYTETFTATQGQSGSTYQRSFRDDSSGRNRTQY